MRQRIFIGSSTEGRGLCDALVTLLTDKIEVVPWYISFSAGQTAVEALLEVVATHDFGAFVLSPDDGAEVRGSTVVLPRDNVLFEAGMFMAVHGPHRTFLVRPTTPNFHLLSDVNGITAISYDPNASSMDIAATPVSRRIREAIDKANRNAPAVSINDEPLKHGVAPDLTWPVKLQLRIKNSEAIAVTIESKSFAFGMGRPATNKSPVGSRVHNVAFKRWVMPNGKGHDQYHDVVFLRPGEEVEAWVAFDPSHTDAELAAFQAERNLGVWHYRATWHYPIPKVYDLSRVF
jgi:Predicted nucleotide-binding protein containing TIR-like domain